MTVGSVKLRCFCDRLSLIFLVGWFLDLKTAGKTAAHYSACAPSVRGPNSVLCPEFLRFKCWKMFASLTSGRNQCDRAVCRVEKKVKFQKKLDYRCMSVDTLFYSKRV